MSDTVIIVEDNKIITTEQTEIKVVQVADQGPRGPQGPPGEAGGATNSITYNLEAAIPISGHRVCTLDDTGKVIYADINNIDHGLKILGVSTHAAAAGAYVQILAWGDLEELSWSWDVDKPLFLGENGTILQNVSDINYDIIIGFCWSPTKIYIRVSQPIFH